MKSLGRMLLFVVALPVLWLGSAFLYETLSSKGYRYRLTLQVDADEKSYVGTGVIRVSLTPKASWIPQSGGAYSGVQGEAVMVNLGSRGTLLALLKGSSRKSDADTIVRAIFPPPNGTKATFAESIDRYSNSKLVAELGAEQLPLLVLVRDIRDPQSAVLVDPDNLAGTFGSGAILRRATLETTRDPVTKEIERTIPWLADKAALSEFSRALLRSGFRPGSSFGVRELLKRG
jgi:hypothetical protein